MVSRGRRGLFFASVCALLLGAATPAQADAGTVIAANFASTVPEAARLAVDEAMSIWSARIDSTVPIDVNVEWGGLPRGVAASTEPLGYFQARGAGELLPTALANAIDGFDHDPSTADVRIRLGSAVRWYTGLDGVVPTTATDMVTIVLHELAHGLGFYGSFEQHGGELGWGRPLAEGVALPVGLDMGLTDVATGERLLTVANPSTAMMNEATSGRIVWGLGARDSRGKQPVIYAPSAYEPHSSLVHLDDAAYPKGDPDSLMTSLIKRGEAIHHIGPATLGILHDLGWTVHPEAPPTRPAAATAGVVPPAPEPAPPAPAPTTSSTSTTVDESDESQGAAVRALRPSPVATSRAAAADERPMALIAGGLLALVALAVKKIAVPTRAHTA